MFNQIHQHVFFCHNDLLVLSREWMGMIQNHYQQSHSPIPIHSLLSTSKFVAMVFFLSSIISFWWESRPQGQQSPGCRAGEPLVSGLLEMCQIWVENLETNIGIYGINIKMEYWK